MKTPHPFPARMAPDLALAMVSRPLSSPLLDPMCGSGMVLKTATAAGHDVIGTDVDPLAVLMSTVWTGPPVDNLEQEAETAVRAAQRLRSTRLDWVDDDEESVAFVEYWFDTPQQHELRRLARILRPLRDATGSALKLALSRTIITKSRGASLASDVSHSRPHRTRLSNDYDVYGGFVQAARKVGQCLTEPQRTSVDVSRQDARNLANVDSNSIGMILTSPPYLNAIDYLRGHRLALIWLGFTLKELRSIRAGSIGAERRLTLNDEALSALMEQLEPSGLEPRISGMLHRYLFDLDSMLSECARVLQPDAEAVFVVGNSSLRGVYIDNASLLTAAGERHGLHLVSSTHRSLPPNRRYLPPPRAAETGLLSKRMRAEVIVKLRK